MSDHNSTVQALLIERIGYERRGRLDRVAQVDALLARMGVAVETTSIEPQEETAARKKPARRKKG
jgi:adenylylsulfate kinase-like enzyme